MPNLPLQDFTALVRNMAAAMRAASVQVLDVSIGTVLRALLEANASVALWLQWLMLEVLATTRASTSQGTDLDTWMADFGVARLPAIAAHGIATLSRLTPGLAATIPAGTAIRTPDGTVRFSVIADASNPAWTGSAYSLAATALALDLPILADAPGSAGNLLPGALSVLATAIAGIDRVVNQAGTFGGLDSEGDTSLRARFANFLDSRSRATSVAVAYAIQSVRQGLRFVVQENVLPGGSPRIGAMTITLDDGTGAPSAALLATVGAAVEAVRPLGVTVTVQPPSVLRADITLEMVLAPPTILSDVAGAVQTAITAWIGAIPIGAPLPRSRLIQLAFAAAPQATDIQSVTIGGLVQDLVPAATTLILPGSITIDAA